MMCLSRRPVMAGAHSESARSRVQLASWSRAMLLLERTVVPSIVGQRARTQQVTTTKGGFKTHRRSYRRIRVWSVEPKVVGAMSEFDS